MSGIVRHAVATHVTATQGTCLGKYLTMPYHKNAAKPILLVVSTYKQHHLDSSLMLSTPKM